MPEFRGLDAEPRIAPGYAFFRLLLATRQPDGATDVLRYRLCPSA